MTEEKLETILGDHAKLVKAVADPDLCPLLPVTAATARALPHQLAPFQAKWLFGNCSDEHLATLREVCPQIVAQSFGRDTGRRYRYSKPNCCKMAKVPDP